MSWASWMAGVANGAAVRTRQPAASLEEPMAKPRLLVMAVEITWTPPLVTHSDWWSVPGSAPGCSSPYKAPGGGRKPFIGDFLDQLPAVHLPRGRAPGRHT